MSATSPSVVVGLAGGLGNQMFQYAAGRSLALRLGAPLSLDLSWFGGQKEREFALSPFMIAASLHVQCSWLPRQGQALASRVARRWARSILGVPVWHEPHFHYAADFDNLKEPIFLEGYWQSERYFKDIRTDLLKDFSLRDPLPLPCIDMLHEIRACDAICVHVRRGDYLSNPEAAKLHGICPVSYYQEGVGELMVGLKNPYCFVFSDDPAWVADSLTLPCPMTVVDVNGPSDAHLDLTLMAACNHFLIANSSLSWWGAWLGGCADKKVIAPRRWFLTQDKNTRDLIPESWLQR